MFNKTKKKQRSLRGPLLVFQFRALAERHQQLLELMLLVFRNAGSLEK